MAADAPADSSRRMYVEIEGLELTGRCGVTEQERALGQQLVIDVRMVPHDVSGATTDDLSGTVDYSRVVEVIAALVEEREYNLVERLATVLADALFDRFDLEGLTLTVRKLRPPVGRPLAAAVARVYRRR